jgi:hypothetical protein
MVETKRGTRGYIRGSISQQSFYNAPPRGPHDAASTVPPHPYTPPGRAHTSARSGLTHGNNADLNPDLWVHFNS